MTKVTDAPYDLSYDHGIISGSCNPGWLLQDACGETVYPASIGSLAQLDLSDLPATAEGAAEAIRRLNELGYAWIELEYQTLA
jgi:hypothetical protein